MRFKTRLCDLFLTLAVLIPFFLFQIGFVYEFAGDAYPSSISLSWHRMSRENGFKLGLVYENDVFAARWLSTYSTGNRRTYTDHERTLNSYALITSNYIYPLTNNTRPFPESYQFFSSERSDLARFSLTIGDSNKVYSNGPCVIFRKEPRTD